MIGTRERSEDEQIQCQRRMESSRRLRWGFSGRRSLKQDTASKNLSDESEDAASVKNLRAIIER